MVRWLVRNRTWLLTLFSALVLSIQVVDLRHQVESSKRDNQKLTQQLRMLVFADIQRTLLSFEYIANDTAHRFINGKSTQNWSHRARIENAFPIESVAAAQHINRYYSDTTFKGQQTQLNNDQAMWRIAYNNEQNSILLIMAKVVNVKGVNQIVEVGFDLKDYPEFIPKQLDASVALIDAQKNVFLREGSEFIEINVADVQSENQSKDGVSYFVTHREIMGYPYAEFGGEHREKYQLITIPIEEMGAELVVLLDKTEVFNNIYDDILETAFAVFGLIIVYLLLCFLARYFSKTQKIMNTDPLTGLNNRRHLTRAKGKMQQKLASGAYSSYGILLIDLDHFKQINDRYGHDVGDKVLMRVSNILKDNVRKQDECYRLGGEEFAITAPINSSNQVIGLAERLREQVEHDQQLSKWIEGGVTASIGVVEHTLDKNINQSLKHADEQLYVAKNSGRNRVEYVGAEIALEI